MDQLFDLVEVAGDVAGDDDVGALVDGDRSAGREEILGAILELLGLGVGDGDEARLDRGELELALAPRDGKLALLVEIGEGATRIMLPWRTMPRPLAWSTVSRA